MPSETTSKERPAHSSTGYSFGTFKGVFTPSLLTVLGVIMYLRFGWVLGNVGLAQTLLIVTLACTITFLTGISISSLATNMRIGGGGAYYIISRSLGAEAGGAIGLPLFLAQALGIAFYIAGFAESVCNLLPGLPQVFVGLITLLGLAALAYFSADIAMKFQFFILTAIILSLGSFFSGHAPYVVSPAAASQYLPTLPFWAVFAVFFPAVTGIEAGLAMSGDLKSPEKSLPLGTLGAIVTSYVVYMAIPIFLNHLQLPQYELMTNSLIFKDVARWGQLVMLGIWGATLSSALGALLGAPRTLQALAKDGVIPRWIGRGFGRNNDPRIATFAAALIGAAGLLLGNLNAIAPLLSMFFLTSYGLLNLSAALEGFLSGPSWRPKFHMHWGFSAAGAIICLVAMLMLNVGATLIAALVSTGVYVLLAKKRVNAYWGDMRYGIYMLMLKIFLYKLTRHSTNEKTWRPNILVLSGSPSTRWYLIALADALSHGKGFLTVATILPKENLTHEQLQNTRESIENYLDERSVPAIVKVMAEEDVLQGARTLVEAYGFGPLIPNTILLGDTEKRDNYEDYCSLMIKVFQLRRNLVIVREADIPVNSTTATQGRIDIWWRQKGQNSGLMLALAYLLTTSPEWEGSEMCIKTIVDSEEDKEEVTQHLEKFVHRENMDASVKVYVAPQAHAFNLLREKSADAAMLFLGLRPPEKSESAESYSIYYQKLLSVTDGFPATALVLSAEDLDFDRIFQLRQTT